MVDEENNAVENIEPTPEAPANPSPEPVKEETAQVEAEKAEVPVETVPVEAAETVDAGPDEAIEEAKETEKIEEAKEKPLWYVVQTLTGYEDRVKMRILQAIAQEHLEEKVTQILIPEEDVVEIREGKRVEKKKKMFPGYVFIEMILGEDTWYTIRQVVGVAKFIGSKTKPVPVTDREMQRVLKQIGMKEERIEVEFAVADAVRIISGPFRGYNGTVEEINEAKEKVRVLINIFGRDTPVEISFDQAEKLI